MATKNSQFSVMRKEITPLDFKELLKKPLKGQFLFYGEETFLKQFYLNQARKNVLGDSFDSVFNHKKIDVQTFDAEKILNAVVSAPSLMTLDETDTTTLCEIHGLDFSSLKDADLKAFLAILSEAEEYGDTVIIVYTNPNEFDGETMNPKSRNKKPYTAICQYLTPINFKIEDETRISKWINKHFLAEKISLQYNVCQAIIDRCGCEMMILSNEISKLISFAKESGKNELTIQDVDYICSYNLKVGAFDFSNALMEKNTEKAFMILTDLKNKKEDPISISSQIIRSFNDIYAIKSLSEMGHPATEIAKKLKMNEFAVSIRLRVCASRSLNSIKKILQKCRETDIQIKSVYQDYYSLLNELVIFASIY